MHDSSRIHQLLTNELGIVEYYVQFAVPLPFSTYASWFADPGLWKSAAANRL